MSNLGMGAAIFYLGGGSPKDPKEYYGKVITDVRIEDNEVRIEFVDGPKIKLWDAGQSCCESRYMSTDDDIKDLIGKPLSSVQLKEAPTQTDDYGGEHEIVFLEIKAGDETNHDRKSQ